MLEVSRLHSGLLEAPWSLTKTVPDQSATTDGYGERLIKNGTWSPTTDSMPHAFLPELGLMITTLHFFMKDCRYQPYITVFRTEGMGQKDIERQMERKWSLKAQTTWSCEQQALDICLLICLFLLNENYVVKKQRGTGRKQERVG
jgi:hypothetical protein